MKFFLLAISILCSTYGFSQDPDPNLYQTWHLDFFQLTDLDPEYKVSQIDPTIAPFLMISENLDFNGEGACNSMLGSFVNSSGNNLEIPNFSHTMDDCGVQEHTSFETAYFDFFSVAVWYDISTDDNGMILALSTPLFGTARFRNYVLNTPDFELNKLDIYPNPSSAQISVISKNTMVERIEMINSYGDTVKTIDQNFDTIDVQELSTGIYIVRVYTENGVQLTRFIKR